MQDCSQGICPQRGLGLLWMTGKWKHYLWAQGTTNDVLPIQLKTHRRKGLAQAHILSPFSRWGNRDSERLGSTASDWQSGSECCTEWINKLVCFSGQVISTTPRCLLSYVWFQWGKKKIRQVTCTDIYENFPHVYSSQPVKHIPCLGKEINHFRGGN